MENTNILLGEMGFSKVEESEKVNNFGEPFIFFPPEKAIQAIKLKYCLPFSPKALILEQGKLIDNGRELTRKSSLIPIEYKLVVLNTSKLCFEALQDENGINIETIEGSSPSYDVSSGDLYTHTRKYKEYLNRII